MTPKKKRTTQNPVFDWMMPISVDTTPHAKVMVGNQSCGVQIFKTRLQGISNKTYPMKYSVSPVRYSSPVMLMSVVKPSIRALPTLDLSRNDRRYSSVKAGRRMRSSFRTSDRSLIPSKTCSLLVFGATSLLPRSRSLFPCFSIEAMLGVQLVKTRNPGVLKRR